MASHIATEASKYYIIMLNRPIEDIFCHLKAFHYMTPPQLLATLVCVAVLPDPMADVYYQKTCDRPELPQAQTQKCLSPDRVHAERVELCGRACFCLLRTF